jgi:coenzyme F420-reducing hydrogenase delta subunit
VAQALGKEPPAPGSCNSCLATGGSLEGQTWPGLAAVRVLCSSRFDPALALEGLAEGCAAILVVGCFHEGPNFAANEPILARRERELRGLMELLGLAAERFGVVRAAPGAEADSLMEGIGAFVAGLGAHQTGAGA